MIRNRFLQFTLAALTTYGALGCESGGVGAPCIPEDEYKQSFSGFAVEEVNVESRSFQCETRVCIVNHFQGRVSCPYGQADPEGSPNNPGPADRARCRVPGGDGTTCVALPEGNVADCNPLDPTPANAFNVDMITAPVEPQLIFRNAADTVYCSCRCEGPDPNARYCECPSGFECQELVREIGVPGRGQLVGSYCIKPGTVYDPTHPPPGDQCLIADGDDPNKTITVAGQTRNVSKTCGRTDNCPDGVSQPCASNPPL
jgi:hypothetical protein